MRHIKCLALVCLFCAPQFIYAAEDPEHQYTAKKQIVFSPESMVAFDRSGKFVASRTQPDGSTTTDFNGSMRSVTVARMGPDGKVETFCTSDEEAAKSWMAGEFDVQTAMVELPVMEK